MKMKIYRKNTVHSILAMWLACCSLSSFSQTNLVPNPSFEASTSCPSTLDQMSLSNGWSSFCPSTDYYHACNTNFVGVPLNGVGYQAAASGVAYAGFQAYDINGFAREIVGSQLSQNLVKGLKYYVSIKVSLAEFDVINKQYQPCNKVGVKFSTIPYSLTNCPPINNFAHVYTNTIISDTMNWTSIKGSFIADSNYKYIMIGNFFDDANTDTIYRTNGIKSYFFLDDICVSTDSLTCYIFDNINDISISNLIKFYPNPVNTMLNIDFDFNEKFLVGICNSLGEEVFKDLFYKKAQVDCSLLTNGLYYVLFSNALTIVCELSNKCTIDTNRDWCPRSSQCRWRSYSLYWMECSIHHSP